MPRFLLAVKATADKGDLYIVNTYSAYALHILAPFRSKISACRYKHVRSVVENTQRLVS